ncbi:hypothetical protein [Pseudomonas flexibilis]|uniref:Uncharacterized protein n=1 Tax=Pseudomonas flexibilis TaxID=706570 RepID=A0A1N7AFP9_9PSED|nr:hypothetical protein [Pseudomonas flexibilis]SIR37967.1 hypothetical protein SAMN05421672_12143 [Pseudomonas flexibilis]
MLMDKLRRIFLLPNTRYFLKPHEACILDNHVATVRSTPRIIAISDRG